MAANLEERLVLNTGGVVGGSSNQLISPDTCSIPFGVSVDAPEDERRRAYSTAFLHRGLRVGAEGMEAGIKAAQRERAPVKPHGAR